MFIDGRTVDEDAVIETDICVIGAGAAGITIARELADTSIQTCLLESGGFEYDNEIQSLYKGENIGLPYGSLETCRFRIFGGSTFAWRGLCRTLDKLDFFERNWVSHSGWPITKEDLDPYYQRAHPVCQLGPYNYNTADYETKDIKRIPLDQERIVTKIFQSSPPTRFGEVYRKELKRVSNVKVYLYATVLDLHTNSDGRTVTRVRVSSISGPKYWVQARQFILATGGIENARLLLLSNNVHNKGIGNYHHLVGRFFMDHPLLKSTGIAALDSEVNLNFNRWRRKVKDGLITGFLTFRQKTQETEKLLNCGLKTNPLKQSKGVISIRRLLKKIGRGEIPENFTNDVWSVIKDIDDVAAYGYRKTFGPKLADLMYWSEPVPNADSRVTLSTQQDPFGQPRVKLDWRLTSMDRQNMTRAHQILGQELGKAGLGRVKLNFIEEEDGWPENPQLSRSSHHNGTTRMSSNPKQGVVDKNCRIHGVSNVYIAGSSVFPTSGHANPTLTIVALAIRLADHIKRVML
jgi:choline dehydrogenase-like flavoprotein